MRKECVILNLFLCIICVIIIFCSLSFVFLVLVSSLSLWPPSSPAGTAAASLFYRALQRVFGSNRTLMLTRSSFPGVGKYSGHWLGDNAANWNDIKWAIPGMLEFGLFGIPYVSTKPPVHTRVYTVCVIHKYKVQNSHLMKNKWIKNVTIDKLDKN